jgi:hypothetical protein
VDRKIWIITVGTGVFFAQISPGTTIVTGENGSYDDSKRETREKKAARVTDSPGARRTGLKTGYYRKLWPEKIARCAGEQAGRWWRGRMALKVTWPSPANAAWKNVPKK